MKFIIWIFLFRFFSIFDEWFSWVHLTRSMCASDEHLNRCFMRKFIHSKWIQLYKRLFRCWWITRFRFDPFQYDMNLWMIWKQGPSSKLSARILLFFAAMKSNGKLFENFSFLMSFKVGTSICVNWIARMGILFAFWMWALGPSFNRARHLWPIYCCNTENILHFSQHSMATIIQASVSNRNNPNSSYNENNW